MPEFRFVKRTRTHADVLAAVGLADLVSGTIEETPEAFHVTGVIPEDLGHDAGYLYLQPKSADSIPNCLSGSEVLDYQQEREKAKRYQLAKAQAREAGAEIAEAIAASAPRDDWRLYQVLNTLQGDGGTNRVVEVIAKQSAGAWKRILREALEALAKGEVPKAPFDLDLVQLFSPHSAKGYARLKPDSTRRTDKTKDAWSEPFVEWLRYRGYFRSACPYFLGPNREHVRLLCPVPRHIGIRAYDAVVKELRKAPVGGSAPRIDCLGTLRLAELLIRKSPEFQTGFLAPAALVSGLFIVQYQSMGNARAVTSMEQLALPDWFPLTSEADARLWLDTLDEHARIVGSLKDSNSDEMGMLIEYRRFLERRGDKAKMQLLIFMELYGIFLLRKRGQNQWRHRQFLVTHLEGILKNEPTYLDILKNPGFRAIAFGLRSATVSAQSRKRNKRDYRDIRYDILPELRRKRTLPGKSAFLEAVADFVASYNAESARRLELGKDSGIKRITTDELQAFMELFDGQKDAALIGAMLCAYATCRDVYEPEVQQANTDSEEVTNAEA
jgi:hypothetical protein